MHAALHEHTKEAIKHLKESSKHTTMQHTMTGVYDSEALRVAETAEKAHGDVHQHMSEALKHLKETETHAKAGHKDKVSEHLDQAIEHIEATL